MLRLVKRASILCLALTLVTGGVAFAARREPLSDFARLFMTNPNGSLCKPPCLFGIRPGFTSYRNGIAAMHAHPIARYFVQPTKALMPNWFGRNFSFVIGTDDSFDELSSRIVSLYMEFSNTLGRSTADVPPLNLAVGDVIRYLGTPNMTLVTGSIARLYYPAHRLTITVALVSRDTSGLDASDPDPVLIVQLR